MILCHTLGPVEVIVDGGAAPPELLWRRHLALLVYLARSPKRTRSRDHLVGLLWPEKAESAARHSLREAVRVLRKCLGSDAVDTQGQLVRLAEGTVQLDVDELETCAARSDWSSAASLVAGEFLEGFAVPGASGLEDWLASERFQWRGRSVDVLIQFGASLLRSGAVAGAGDAARRAVALEPLSEGAVGLTMRVAALRGDRNAALSAFDDLTTAMREASGAEPSRELCDLATRIRLERLPAPADVHETVGAESRRGPLVGRERVLRQLCEAWEQARDGRGAPLLVIEGELGYGKTRLLDEVTQRARLDGATASVVRLVEADLETECGGLLGLAGGGLIDAPGLSGARPEAFKTFATELPEWSERFRPATGVLPLDGDRAFRELVSAAVEEGPVLLAVDDAHWLDRTSVLSLEALLRDLSGQRIAVLVTLASHPHHDTWDRIRSQIGRDLEGVSVTLKPLGPADVRVMARWALPTYRDDEIERVARRVTLDSAGLPLLVVELFHAIALGLDLAQTDAGAWPQPLQTLDQSLPGDLPDAVVAAIRVGYRRLSAGAQRVLAVASVMTDRVTADDVMRATEMERADVVKALDEVEWQRWIVAESRGYGFVARIVRKVIAQDMVTAGQRVRIRETLDLPL